MANFLSKLFSSKLLAGSDNVLGVDIGSSAVKIVQIKKNGGDLILENYGSLALGPYAELAVGQATSLTKGQVVGALGDLLRETKINAAETVLAIPMKSTMFAVIEMPELKRKQLEEVIPMEARKYIPVPIEEVALDSWVIPQDEEVSGKGRKKVNVLIAAIHKETLGRHQDIEAELGLSGGAFEIEIFSTIRAVARKDSPTALIVDIGATTTKVALVKEGEIRNTQLINHGAEDATTMISKSFGLDFAEAEAAKRGLDNAHDANASKISHVVDLSFSPIFSNIERVLSDYQRKYNITIEQVILSGGGVSSAKVQAMAKSMLRRDVIVGDPFAKMQTPDVLSATLKEIGPEFAVAAGAALSAFD